MPALMAPKASAGTAYEQATKHPSRSGKSHCRQRYGGEADDRRQHGDTSVKEIVAGVTTAGRHRHAVISRRHDDG